MSFEDFSSPSFGHEQQNHGFFENLFNEFVHITVEDTANSVTQFANHMTGMHIPELEIVDDADEGSAGGLIGGVAGGTLKFIGGTMVAAATLPVSASFAGAMAAGAIAGATYSLLTPEAEGEGNFFVNKFTDVAIGGATGAVFGGAAKALSEFTPLGGIKGSRQLPNGMSMFDLTRSLPQDLAIGGTAGAVTGVANAEMNALLHEDRFATPSELGEGLLIYGAGGALSGAAHHVMRGVVRNEVEFGKGHGLTPRTQFMWKSIYPFGQ